MPEQQETTRTRLAALLREAANHAEALGGRAVEAIAARADQGAAGALLRRVQHATGKMADEGTLPLPNTVRQAMGQVHAMIKHLDAEVHAEAEAAGVGQAAKVSQKNHSNAQAGGRPRRSRHKKNAAEQGSHAATKN